MKPELHITLKDAVSVIRAAEIRPSKDETEEHWNAEMERIIDKLCALPNPKS